MRSLFIITLSMCVIFGVFHPGYAQYTNLEYELPVHLEDAFPILYRDRELHGFFQYVEQRGQQYRFNLTPAVEAGFPKRTQLELEVPLIFGKTNKTGSADIRPSVFYNFNNERVHVPAFAIETGIGIPTGNNSRGVDPRFKFLMTKTLGGRNLNQIHVNGEYGINVNQQPRERRHLYIIAVGYSQRLGRNSIAIFDFYRERDRDQSEESNVFEMGSRVQLDPFMIFSIGGGVGAGNESPRFQFTMGLERLLNGRFFIF